MLKISEINDIDGKNYQINGLKDIQVLRILKALEATNKISFCIELQVMIDIFKQDIKRLNKNLTNF